MLWQGGREEQLVARQCRHHRLTELARLQRILRQLLVAFDLRRLVARGRIAIDPTRAFHPQKELRHLFGGKDVRNLQEHGWRRYAVVLVESIVEGKHRRTRQPGNDADRVVLVTADVVHLVEEVEDVQPHFVFLLHVGERRIPTHIGRRGAAILVVEHQLDDAKAPPPTSQPPPSRYTVHTLPEKRGTPSGMLPSVGRLPGGWSRLYDLAVHVRERAIHLPFGRDRAGKPEASMPSTRRLPTDVVTWPGSVKRALVFSLRNTAARTVTPGGKSHCAPSS